MNKRILVSESEKSSILKMHESFKNRGIIKEDEMGDMGMSSKGTLLKNITRAEGLSNETVNKIKSRGNKFEVTVSDEQIMLNGKPSYQGATVTPETTISCGGKSGLINLNGVANFAIGCDFEGLYLTNEQ